MSLKNLLHTKELFNNAWLQSGDFVEYTDEQLREKQMKILGVYKAVLAVCNENQIPVALCGGTALGAMRHKGFIPWDDDVDIAMPRKDCERFKEIFESALGDEYILNCPNFSKAPIARFAKVFRKDEDFDGKTSPEIYVDIFFIENASQSKLVRKVKGFFCDGLMFVAGAVGQYEGALGELPDTILQSKTYKTKNRIGRCFSFMPAAKWFNLVDKVIRKRKETDFCTMPTGRKHYNGELLERKIVYPFREVEFEDTTSFVFGDINGYLTHMYGPDYMTPPPENKREKHYKKKADA